MDMKLKLNAQNTHVQVSLYRRSRRYVLARRVADRRPRFFYRKIKCVYFVWWHRFYSFLVNFANLVKARQVHGKPSQNSELRNLPYGNHTCSATCHPTQVNTPRLNPSQKGWYSIYRRRRDGRLS